MNAYENAAKYKEKTKRWHNKKLVSKTYDVGDNVLLFNSRLRLFPGKLKSKWSGPFVVHKMYSHGAVELLDDQGVVFKVNRHRLKRYYDGNEPKVRVSYYLDPPTP